MPTADIKELSNQLKTLEATPSYQKYLDFFSFVKRTNLGARCAPEICKHVVDLIQKSHKKLGDKKWAIFEQAVRAYLDCGNPGGRAQTLLEALQGQFPNSRRTIVLEAMVCEYEGEFKDANDLYDELLSDDPTNSLPYKRKVAIAKAQGNRALAVKTLTAYLSAFPNDTRAWQELAELYIVHRNYSQAKFCLEEVLLAQPQNFLIHLQFAELLYTIGGRDNLELARNYYLQSLELNPESNLRSLWGLALTLRSLAEVSRNSLKSQHESLQRWSAESILEMYRERDAPEHMLEIVENVLAEIGDEEVNDE